MPASLPWHLCSNKNICLSPSICCRMQPSFLICNGYMSHESPGFLLKVYSREWGWCLIQCATSGTTSPGYYTLSFTSLAHLIVEVHLFKSSQLQSGYLQEDIFHYQINNCYSKKDLHFPLSYQFGFIYIYLYILSLLHKCLNQCNDLYSLCMGILDALPRSSR